MKKLFLIITMAATLGGCASFQQDVIKAEQDVSNAFHMITSASVSPQQILVAANSFDALEATVAQYLTYCDAKGKGTSACALSTRKLVVKATRAGRAARDQLEPYVVSNTAGPRAIFNTLTAAISTLNASPVGTGAQ